MIHAGNSYANGLIDRNGYQGKTKEAGLNRIDLGFRSFNPTTGIFDRSDPMAEMTPDFSPFSYTLNNPVNFIDEFGLSGSGWNTRGRQETEAESANKEQMQQSENRTFIRTESQKLFGNGSGMLPGADVGTKGWSRGEKTTGNVLSFTDVNDVTVLVTMLTRGGSAVNIDGTSATFSDKLWAAGGLIIPAASGSAIKKVGGKLIQKIKGGVYALLNNDIIVRTGRSKDLVKRAKDHASDPKLADFDFQTLYKTDNLFEQRGLEDLIARRFSKTADASNGGFNKIKAISDKNVNKTIYRNAARNYIKKQKK